MKDRLVAAGLLVASLAYVLAARGFEAGFIADPIGPSAFPLGIGTLLALACLTLLLRGGGGRLPQISWRHGAVFVALVTYSLVLELLGFVLATTALASVIARLFGGPIQRSVLVSFLLSASIYVVFAYGLSIRLPRGF